MNVAIVGAGPSGLSCALELERYGISPVIFEQRHRPGELFEHIAAYLNLYTRPYDLLSLLRGKFNLDVLPLNRIKTITHYSPQKRVDVTGSLGYFFMRGQDAASVESQLFKKLKAEIVTNTQVNDYSELSGQFDYIVVANGSYNMSRMAGVWSLVYPTKLIGGTVLGNFDRTKMIVWLDTRYCKTAYAYLCPFDKKKAFLGLVVPEATVEEAREKWKLFWQIERLTFEQINEVVVEHNAGFVYPHQVGNVMFAGIAGGMLDPFLGFGLLPALESGVLAARAIATGLNYEDLLFRLKQEMLHALVLRELFNNAAKNEFYDRLITLIGVPGLKHLVYNTNIDVIRIGASAYRSYKEILNGLKRY